MLPKNQKGDVVRKTGDFATRKGQCIEPVSRVDLFPFTVTHKVGNSGIKNISKCGMILCTFCETISTNKDYS